MMSASSSSHPAQTVELTLKQVCSSYVALTKPTIVLLFVYTAIVDLLLQSQQFEISFLRAITILAGITLIGGSANALNQVLDRDIDSQMVRTRHRRPLPMQKISTFGAIIFACFLGLLGLVILASFHSAAAFWGAFTIFYYVVIYTLWLKRRTPQNIVIGGLAGAVAPWITSSVFLGWNGIFNPTSSLLVLLTFLWTPPHFWALALRYKKDYESVSVPMLPVVAGERATKYQIWIYTVLMVACSLGIVISHQSLGVLSWVVALFLGSVFLKKSYDLLREVNESEAGLKKAWSLFGFSILYLFVLLTSYAVDAVFITKKVSPSVSSLIFNQAEAAEDIPRELQGIGISEKLGQKVDPTLIFRNEKGERVTLGSVLNGKTPVLLGIVYYTCPNLCNFFMNGVFEGLQKSKYKPGRDYQFLTVSMDPRETPLLALKKKQNYLTHYQRESSSSLVEEAGWHFWVEPTTQKDPHYEGAVKSLSRSVGFGYNYNDESQQFAHSAALIVLSPQGVISRYLYGIQFLEKNIDLALVEAGQGKVGTLVDRLILFCYHFDGTRKTYAFYANNLMKVVASSFALIFILWLAWMFRRRPLLRRS